MRCGFILGVLAALLFVTPTLAEPLSVADPDRLSSEIFSSITQAKFHEAAKRISETIGKPDLAQTMESALKILEGKKFDFGKKVLDREFNGALRQTIYYSYYENVGFIYFRFTFKMTSKGWLLTNFFFKDATQELFPKDLIEGPLQ